MHIDLICLNNSNVAFVYLYSEIKRTIDIVD